MIEGNNMTMLAHSFLVLYTSLYCWPALITGTVGWFFTYSRTGRKSALVIAFITLGIVIFQELWLLSFCGWNPWWMLQDIMQNLITVMAALLSLGVPSALAVMTVYRCRKDRPLK